MNYYAFHIGDYAVHTRHLSLLEDLAYRRLLDLYYTRELPLPTEVGQVSRLIGMRENVQETQAVLQEFFLLTEAGWTHARCDVEIAKATRNAEVARENGRLGGRPKGTKTPRAPKRKNPAGSQQEPGGNPEESGSKAPNTQYPIPKEIDESISATADFDQAYAAYPKRPGVSRADAHKAWKARIAAGADAAAILAGVQRYAAYVMAEKTEPRFIKQPCTFFGPGLHYESDWTPSASGLAPPDGAAAHHRTDRATQRAETIAGLTGRARPGAPYANRSPSPGGIVDVAATVVADGG